MLKVLIYVKRDDWKIDRLLWSLANDPPADKFQIIVLDPTNSQHIKESLDDYCSVLNYQIINDESKLDKSVGPWLVLPANAWPTSGVLAEATKEGRDRLIKTLEGGLRASLLNSLGEPHSLILNEAHPISPMGWYGDYCDNPPIAAETSKPIVVWPPKKTNLEAPLCYLTSPQVEFRLAVSRCNELIIQTNDYQSLVSCDQGAFKKHLSIVTVGEWSPECPPEPTSSYWELRSLAEGAWSAAEAGQWELMGRMLDKSWGIERASANCGPDCDIQYAARRIEGMWGGRATKGGFVFLAPKEIQ